MNEDDDGVTFTLTAEEFARIRGRRYGRVWSGVTRSPTIMSHENAEPPLHYTPQLDDSCSEPTIKEDDTDMSSVDYVPVHPWGKGSKKQIVTLDPRLVYLCNGIGDIMNSTIVKGHRNEEEQNRAYYGGYSRAKWGESEHNHKVSRAVDIVPYPTMWDDIPALDMMLGAALAIAKRGGFEIVLGKYFSNLPDYAHIELKG